jgi:vacuolar-type H+-ATPase subunit I/STV1
MDRNLQTAFNKLQRKQVELNKTQLSIVDEIDSEYESLERAYSEASYLAYEYGDEIMEAFSDLRMKYSLDDYIINGETRSLEEYAQNMQAKIDQLEQSAEELGVDPAELIRDYEDIKQILEGWQGVNNDAFDKYKETIQYTGDNDFWR